MPPWACFFVYINSIPCHIQTTNIISTTIHSTYVIYKLRKSENGEASILCQRLDNTLLKAGEYIIG